MGKVKEIMQTAPCRFCGQMVQFMGDDDLTDPQAQEIATMNCSCDKAVEYQKEKKQQKTTGYQLQKIMKQDIYTKQQKTVR